MNLLDRAVVAIFLAAVAAVLLRVGWKFLRLGRP